MAGDIKVTFDQELRSRKVIFSLVVIALNLVIASAGYRTSLDEEQEDGRSTQHECSTLTNDDHDVLISDHSSGRLLLGSSLLTSSNSSCEWFLEATSGQILLVRIDSVRSGTLTLIMDENVTIVSSADVFDCDLQLSGRSFQLMWSTRGTRLDGINVNDTSPFTLRYAIFESDVCQVPAIDDVENVVLEGSGATPGSFVHVHSRIRYACVGTPSTSTIISECLLKFTSPKPAWSHLPPICHRHHDCSAEPIRVRLETNGSLTLAYEGRLGLIDGHNCLWEIEAVDKGAFIGVHVEWFHIDERLDNTAGPSLELYDGERTKGRLLKRLRGHSTADEMPTIFVSLHGKIVIALNDTEAGVNATSYDWYARFVSQLTPRCQPPPTAPTNGDVRGSQTADDLSANTIVVVAVFTCNDGYRLVGSELLGCTTSGGSWSAPMYPTCQPLGLLDVVASPEKTLVQTPHQPGRPNKLSRPHPQSTEEKGYKKSLAGKTQGSGADVAASVMPPLVSEEEEEEAAAEAEKDGNKEEPQFSGEPDINWRIGQADYENTLSGYSEMDDEYDERQFLENHRDKENDRSGNDGGGDNANRFPVMAIALAVTLPLLAFTVVLVSCLLYRKLYPVRMGPGRRFETFENPIYGRSGKRGSTMTSVAGGQSASPVQLAQNPAELERLTDVNVST